MKNIRAHVFPFCRQWEFESHKSMATGLPGVEGEQIRAWRWGELGWGGVHFIHFSVGGVEWGVGPWSQGHSEQGQPHLFSPILAIASLARKSNLSSLIRVEQSEQWAPSSKLTAGLNGVEEPGRNVCFVCLELVPSNGSFPNSNCETT